ncbi:hypothetical protein LPJ56_000449 [Coemansia sp. RSA 2599]|nr:hypothetical protein LPJ75_000104 [Coemansia sp. RSA 2598]KAJ1829350.1 hypothetical protein LPJ56_000449 [Coemansia sp. RSA 2599]
MVYKDAFIDNTSHGNSSCTQWRTNVNLIRDNNLVHLVKNLYINLSDHSCLCLFLSSANKTFGFDNHRWTNVQMLTVKYYENMLDDQDIIDDDQIKIMAPQMSDFADAIVKNMPGVNRLKLSTFKRNSLGDIVSNTLANSFASQLYLIKSLKSISFTVPKLGSNITYLNLWLDPKSTQLLPLVNAESLHCVNLFSVPVHFTWKYFYSESSEEGCICFRNLRHLRLEFTEECNDFDYYASCPPPADTDERTRFHVQFPKLHFLRIDNSPRTSDIYFDNVYPEHIERIEINYSIGAMEMLRQSNIKSFDAFEFYSQHMYLEDEDMFYRATNHFFGPENKGSMSRMTLSILEFELDVQRIEWSRLNELLIFGSCGYQTMYALIEKLPMLVKIAISDLCFDNIPETKLLMDSDSYQDVPQKYLDSKIQQIHIFNTSGSQCYSSAGANCIQCLILQMRALCELSAYECDWLNLSEFIEQYKGWYPHLEKIVVNH